ncbi:SBBP repeat-containing protein, partial [Pontibacter toksunensis]
MKKHVLHAVVLLLVCVHFFPVHAQQPTLEWAKLYNTTISTNEGAAAIAVDAEGNSYVTGTSSGAIITNIVTVKYDPSGAQLWAVLYPKSSRAIDIAIDNNGNIYVTGTSSGTEYGTGYTTIRYDAATGEEIWAQYYPGPEGGSGNASATAIAVDDANGVYVTGAIDDIFGRDIATVRYDAATGEETWNKVHSGGPGDDYATAIAVDNTGGIYVTGSSAERRSTPDYLTVRYNAATGEEAWVRLYNSPATGADRATAIAVDNAGGVYVTGYSEDEQAYEDYATVRYAAATGEETWVSRYGVTGANERASAIAVDASGGVYVTGFSARGLRGSQNIATVRYEATTGEETWTQQYGNSIESDEATAIAVDNAGGVYVTGYSFNDGPNSNQDYATLRYNAATGEETWVTRYNGPANSADRATAIAVNTGSVYVTGYSTDFSQDFATIRYNAATGNRVWVQLYGSTGNTDDKPIAVAVDAEGNSYVTGNSFGSLQQMVTVKYSPSGEQLWAVQFQNITATAIAVDNTGGVYVTGTNSGTTAVSYATVRYEAATGVESWVQFYNGSGGGPSFAKAIAVDNTGGVYVTGERLGSSPLFASYATVRYEATTGEQTWDRLYSSGNAPSSPTAITVDNAGGVYVTGTAFGNRFSFSDYATVRYQAATGEQTWARLYSGPGNENDVAVAIASDNAGGVYVTGYSYGNTGGVDYATVRYEAGSGTESWARLYNGPGNESDFAADIAVDYAGGVYITGSSGTNLNSDYATLRYDAITGEETWAQRYNSSGGTFERASAIAVNNAGVYVTGYSSTDNTLLGSDFATVRYDAATGDQIWAEHYAASTNNVDVAVDLALDLKNNVIVTGYTFSPVTGNDFLTIKYSQQAQCPDVTDAVITGLTSVQAGTAGSAYSLPNTGANSFSWLITDSQGNPYTNFTGQGTSSITVDWPSAPDFFKVSVSSGGPGGGCVVSTSVTYVSVFDPTAGFVTGGGWIESPAAPAYEFMQTSKRAHWSLVARYSKRNGEEDQVQGSTMLLLQAGSFTFRSTSYEPGSLVITGNRAYYSGRGTLTRRDG